jgi:hypothetical protein
MVAGRTARSSQTITASSMNTESGQSSAAGTCWISQPLAASAPAYTSCWARATSTRARLMWVTMPSASLLLGARTSAIPFTGHSPYRISLPDHRPGC